MVFPWKRGDPHVGSTQLLQNEQCWELRHQSTASSALLSPASSSPPRAPEMSLSHLISLHADFLRHPLAHPFFLCFPISLFPHLRFPSQRLKQRIFIFFPSPPVAEQRQTRITGLCSSRGNSPHHSKPTWNCNSLLHAWRRSQLLWVGARANLTLAFRPGFISVLPRKAGF